MKKDLLRFKYGVSKAQESYGYNIVSLYINGVKKHSCNGGGYDMRGTCFAEYLQDNFYKRLETITANKGSLDDGTGYYGLSFYGGNGAESVYHKQYQHGDRINLDGACGMSEMLRIAKAIGLTCEYMEDDIILVIDTQ